VVTSTSSTAKEVGVLTKILVISIEASSVERNLDFFAFTVFILFNSVVQHYPD
jgi:hypothetical protein